MALYPIIAILTFALWSHAETPKPQFRTGLSLPSEVARKEMFQRFVEEIDRLDGEGLIPRYNRPESWKVTTLRLEKEAGEAKDLFSFGRVFKRLDATYPNLHAKVMLLPELDRVEDQGEVNLSVEFAPEVIDRDQAQFKYRITKIPANSIFKVGDEMVAINGMPINLWSEQNFIFCKYPLRQQCELVFFENFKRELLDWDRTKDLSFEVLRSGKKFNFAVSIEIKKKKLDFEGFEFMDPPCGVSDKRYPGWHLVYQGYNFCSFESKKHPKVILMRIRDFMYGAYRGRPAAPLQLSAEIELFYTNFWKKKAAETKTIILDLIDNPGGNEPIPHYQLFFDRPFQEQFTQFKKIQEFERKDILDSIYWGESAKNIWLKNIKQDGTFASVKEGDFLPYIPQFCADQEKDCREGLFSPRKHGFKGKVKLLFNHHCVSSCVGFIYNIIDVLKNRVSTFGIPDSADSAYARLTLGLDLTKENKIKTEVVSLNEFKVMTKDSPWVREAVCVSRTTDRKGNILSGKPMRVDTWVPKKWNQTDDQWIALVLLQALR